MRRLCAAVGWMASWALACTNGGGSASGASQTQSAPEADEPAATQGTANEAPPEETPDLVAFEIPARPPVARIPAPDPSAAGQCPKRKAKDVGIIISPKRPAAGRRVNVVAASLEREGPLAIRIETESGEHVPVDTTHRGGVPVSAIASFEVPSSGTFVVTVGQDGEGLRCAKFWASQHPPKRSLPEPNLEQVWEAKRAWDASNEALYSAWVRELFYAPPGDSLAFSALDELTSDPDRNLLHDYYGWREDHDSEGLNLNPDCADTPYFLRAYFAWKRGLPFGFRTCSRGRSDAPQCFDLRTTAAPPSLKETWVDVAEPEPYDQLMVIDRFFRRTLAWGVHTGNGRTAYGDSNSDLYPVRLDRRGLRPGIVYADPYGHIFVMVGIVEQQGDFPGILYAVDGQPDGSITRKRFWEGNFLWNPDPKLGGSGFKAFRPLLEMTDEQGIKTLVPLDDATLSKRKDYGDVSEDQSKLTRDEFYDRVERIISPQPRDPIIAQAEAVLALAEAAAVRVTSVNNGLKWQAEHPEGVIEMPWGHDVFETAGAWENFSTPARDLRLLIAMDVVANFERKVERQPDAYGLEAGPGLEAALEKVRAVRQRLLSDPKYAITYAGSDGTNVTLTLAQLFERGKALEMAYNPNDCAEVRWGAPKGSEEASRCTRRAPEDQLAKMKAYRGWFANRQRPGRGDPGPDVPGFPRPEETPED